MSNETSVTRTNYFKVKDSEAFEAFVSTIVSTDEPPYVFEKHDGERGTLYAFGCYGSILGVKDPDSDEDDAYDYNYDDVVAGLQKLVADDDAIIITECSYERLRYIYCDGMIITSNKAELIELGDLFIKKAAELLENPDFTTRMAY